MTAHTTPVDAPTRVSSPLARQLPAMVRGQALILLRTPALVVGAVALPIILYVVLGTSGNHQPEHGVKYAAYTLASLGAYAAGAVMVFNFGITLALERGQGVDRLFRASPLRPWIYLAAKAVVALVVGLIADVLLLATAALITHAGLQVATMLGLLVRLLAGSLAFLAIGMTIGYAVAPSSAAPVATLTYLLLAIAGGMFIPLSQLPSGVRHVAKYLPTYHFGQLAWGALHASDESSATAALWLAGYAVVFFALAGRYYGRVQTRRFS